MTASELLIPVFLRGQIVVAGATLLVLALRAPVRRLFGAELAYRLWVLPLVAVTVGLFPDLREAGMHAPLRAVQWEPLARQAAPFLTLWIAGAAGVALVMALGEWRFRRLMRRGGAGPAVIGVAWPLLVVPSDYQARFTPAERGFIREHERVHMRRGDPKANLLIAALQAVCWFNPLVHVAAAVARLDQELACDAVVIERYPRQRRAYAEALLKAQSGAALSPIACFWSLGSTHPLELRVRLLAQRPVSLKRWLAGAGAISALCVGCAIALWAFAPL